MKKRERGNQPTWTDIKRYVEGRLLNERRRPEDMLAKGFGVTGKEIRERFARMDEQLESLGIQVAKMLDAGGCDGK